MGNLLNYVQAHIIHLGLGIVLILLILYLTSGQFRLLLSEQNIDPNFVIGFSTVIALFLSLIQSSKDKRYAYNLKLIESIESNGLKIIGKLLRVRHESLRMLNGIKACKEAIDSGMVYRDLNNTLLKEDLEKGMDLVVAYIDTYFPEQKQKWNELIDKLNQLGNIHANILVNYNENISLIGNPSFRNPSLDNIVASINKCERINEEVEKLTSDIRDGIVSKMNDSKSRLKKTFDFRF